MKKIVIVTPNKEVKDEIVRRVKAMSDLPLGSEEYLSEAKSINQLAETSQKLKKDILPWVALGTNVLLTVVVIVAGQTSIIDTRPITAMKSIFSFRK